MLIESFEIRGIQKVSARVLLLPPDEHGQRTVATLQDTRPRCISVHCSFFRCRGQCAICVHVCVLAMCLSSSATGVQGGQEGKEWEYLAGRFLCEAITIVLEKDCN